MQNLEQKFRCADLAATEARARALGAADQGIIQQHDLFFPAPQARLKLRLFPSGPAELIAYRRPDAALARTCEYHITRIADSDSLVTTLTHALGPARHLKKSRHLYLYQSTRIHLDTVVGLGTFCELETVMAANSRLSPPLSLAAAQAEMQHVIAALGLTESVPTAYIDLLPVP